jgi:hypothetical protein
VKSSAYGVVLALVALPVAAKDKIITLADADAAALQGKTVALTVHERPSFVAMTAGKAAFALFGVGAMVKAGNDLVDSNHVADPAILLRDNLATALQTAYGVTVLPADTKATDAKKPAELAALHPDADYVLDVRSGGWNFAYFPTSWSSYWVGYSGQVQLINAKTGALVSNAACNTSTHDNAHPPSREQLVADGAVLLKQVTTALGWTCVQLLAKEELHLPADKIPATPAEFVDPLANLASATHVAPVAGNPPNEVTGSPNSGK